MKKNKTIDTSKLLRKPSGQSVSLPTIRSIPISKIKIPKDRGVTRDVSSLAESIKHSGMLNPPTVDRKFLLIAGRHRIAAAIKLGWKTILVQVVCLRGAKAELAKIDENLERNILDELEACEQLKRRKELHEELGFVSKHGGERKKGKSRNPHDGKKSFAEETEKVTGRSPRVIQESIQLATNICDGAKVMIRGTDFADRKTDLLSLSRMDQSEQVKVAKAVKGGAETLAAAKKKISPGKESKQSSQTIGQLEEFVSQSKQVAALGTLLTELNPKIHKFPNAVRIRKKKLGPGTKDFLASIFTLKKQAKLFRSHIEKILESE